MTPLVNLHILEERFTQLSRSIYFDPAFRDFSQRTVHAIRHVIDNAAKYPDEVIRQFEKQVWRVMQFVRGSRSKDAPHETQFVLRKALKGWIPEEALISSAALEDFDFFLNPEDIWVHIERTLNHFDTNGYRPLVVRIGSPEAFKHRPIFCVPLFHELGHFVDHYFKISEFSLLLSPIGPHPPGISPDHWQFINLHHRMEYFADLFAASYCGEASSKSLMAIAPSNPDSPTHPATKKRTIMIADFLHGTSNPTIDLLQLATEARTGQRLKPIFLTPDVKGVFDDVLTYKIANERELFGIFLAGWDYFHSQLENPDAPWVDEQVTFSGIEKTVNDLVEKSIRNYEICERWANVTADKN